MSKQARKPRAGKIRAAIGSGGGEALPSLKVSPLTPKRWPDFEMLFGERGACGGCWCMYWRIPRSQFEKRKGAGNKRAMKKMVNEGTVPGLIAYAAGEPIAWCALAPRQDYPVLQRSRVLKPVDEAPVWSVVCFFVAKPFRKRGVSAELLRAAVQYAKRKGARLVEGYPIAPKKASMPDVFAWTGLSGTFLAAGFMEVARRSPTRPIMRIEAKKAK